MFADVPLIVREAAAWIGAIGVITAGTVGLFTRKPFRWLWARIVTTPASEFLQHAINESSTGKLVAYHLGPNGTTPALHTRLSRLEVRELLNSDLGALYDFEDEEGDD
jgi:hypothetical protein